MNVSHKLGIDINSHKELDFVDIDLSKDSQLFIDPGLLYFNRNKDNLSKTAAKVIDNYFDNFFYAYKNELPYKKKWQLLSHCHEPHYTKLGYGNGDNGKAKTPEGLIAIFKPLEKAFSKDQGLSHVLDLSICMDGFAEDCLSDMLTNILFEILNTFTLQQCKIHGVEKEYIKVHPQHCYYWNLNNQRWDISSSLHLIIDGKIILLMPKKWVRSGLYYNSEHFIRSMVLTRLQKEQTVFLNGKIQKPFKKDLREDLRRRHGSTIKIIHKFIDAWPEILNNYHEGIYSAYMGRSLSDARLDEIVYKG